MNSIEDDVKLIGLNQETWRRFKEMYVQDDLPYFQQQDDKEAFIRHKEAMAKRWFGYYKKCKDPQKKMSLIDSYNIIAHQRQR